MNYFNYKYEEKKLVITLLPENISYLRNFPTYDTMN